MKPNCFQVTEFPFNKRRVNIFTQTLVGVKKGVSGEKIT